MCLSALNDWIEKRNLEYGFLGIERRIDFEDRRDFFVQRVVSWFDGKIVRVGFGGLKGFAAEESWGKGVSESFLVGVRGRRIRAALGVWRKLAVMNRGRRPAFEIRLREMRVVNMWKKWTQRTFVDDASLLNRKIGLYQK